MSRVMRGFSCDPIAVGATGLPSGSAVCLLSSSIFCFSDMLFAGFGIASSSESLWPTTSTRASRSCPWPGLLVGCGQRRAQRRCEATGRRVPGMLQPSCYPETGEEKTRLQPAGTRSTVPMTRHRGIGEQTQPGKAR